MEVEARSGNSSSGAAVIRECGRCNTVRAEGYICAQSYRRPVHFLVMSSMERYSILNRLSSVGKTALDLVTLRSCRLKPYMALVV